jgi:hypothetical protein
MIDRLKALLERAITFLREAAEPFEDDGGNEPLELSRDIEQALSETADEAMMPFLKPLTWDEHGDEWMCDKGFHIEDLENDPNEIEDGKRYRACWGEGEPECFATLEEAKADCERQWAEFVGGQITYPTPLEKDSG